MRLFHTRYLMALLCMLAAGTWILPVPTLAAPTPRPVPFGMLPDGDDADLAAALEFLDALEAMRLAGELDRLAFTFTAADLTGDGVADAIEVFPPQRLETPGFVRVIDGVTGAERFALQSTVGEMGFGEHMAVVRDCDGDTLPDVVVCSWLDAADDPASPLMLLRVRVFSGGSGDLVGLLETTRAVGSPVMLSDFTVVVAGDANLDGAIDVDDIIIAGEALAADAAHAPTVDCKTDGALTVEDFSAVVDRVLDEPQAQRAALYSMALRNIEVVVPIAPPGSEIDPTQMGGGGAPSGGGVPPCVVQWQPSFQCLLQAARLGYDVYRLTRNLIACSGPQAPFCVLPILCQLVSVINQIFLFVDQCMTNGACIPDWMVGISALLALLGAICNGELRSLTESQRSDVLRRLRQLRRLIA